MLFRLFFIFSQALQLLNNSVISYCHLLIACLFRLTLNFCQYRSQSWLRLMLLLLHLLLNIKLLSHLLSQFLFDLISDLLFEHFILLHIQLCGLFLLLFGCLTHSIYFNFILICPKLPLILVLFNQLQLLIKTSQYPSYIFLTLSLPLFMLNLLLDFIFAVLFNYNIVIV